MSSMMASVMNLMLISQERADETGAYCLDGSRPGFYYAPATNPKANNSWLIYLQGGGYCASMDDCAGRAQGPAGSSNPWGETFVGEGPLSGDPAVNLAWGDFHRIRVGYCDGYFYSSNREDPVMVGGQKLYFRGKRVLNAVLDTLDDMGMINAKEIVLSGCSAGGMAVYLQGDYVHSRYPNTRFRNAPVSGFFPLHADYEGSKEEMYNVINAGQMQGADNGMDGNNCWQQMTTSPPPFENPAGVPWPAMCIFSNFSFAFMNTSTFVINSELDAYSLEVIWGGDKECVDGEFQFGSCSPKEIRDLNNWAHDFRGVIRGDNTLFRSGNGAFIGSCKEHCGAESDEMFSQMKINGTTMAQAIYNWYHSEGEPGERHVFLDCYLNPQQPAMCNPACVHAPN